MEFPVDCLERKTRIYRRAARPPVESLDGRGDGVPRSRDQRPRARYQTLQQWPTTKQWCPLHQREKGPGYGGHHGESNPRACRPRMAESGQKPYSDQRQFHLRSCGPAKSATGQYQDWSEAPPFDLPPHQARHQRQSIRAHLLPAEPEPWTPNTHLLPE